MMMTGGSATIVRGAIMAIILLIAQLSHRYYDVVRALLVTGIFMLILNPMLLVFDASYQLSFIATIGLIFGSPIIKKYCCRG
ncbi:hypothetical protein B4Q13_18335 [Lacticaseibacillus rhamnosus]